MEQTIQSVYRKGFAGYAGTHGLNGDQRRAGHALMACRSAQLGGHVVRCEHGHVEGVWYNSCRHRSCAQCAALPKARWLEAERARLLDCPHRHVVFTVPHELNGLWVKNRRAFTDILFRAVSETLLELLGDRRHMGGQPGVLLALHTWGRALALHVHIHALVTDGGLDGAEQWVTPRRASLVPYRVVEAVYRGKLTAGLIHATRRERLKRPEGRSRQHQVNELQALGERRWHVRVGERYGHGAGVATYLARYIRGGALGEQQLRGVTDDTIAFTTKVYDGERRRRETVRLDHDAFLARHLQHVMPQGKAQVRRYASVIG